MHQNGNGNQASAAVKLVVLISLMPVAISLVFYIVFDGPIYIFLMPLAIASFIIYKLFKAGMFSEPKPLTPAEDLEAQRDAATPFLTPPPGQASVATPNQIAELQALFARQAELIASAVPSTKEQENEQVKQLNAMVDVAAEAADAIVAATATAEVTAATVQQTDWEVHTTTDGRSFLVDHVAKTMDFEQRMAPDGRAYYVNHRTQQTRVGGASALVTFMVFSALCARKSHEQCASLQTKYSGTVLRSRLHPQQSHHRHHHHRHRHHHRRRRRRRRRAQAWLRSRRRYQSLASARSADCNRRRWW
jgi:hypothetical protein